MALEILKHEISLNTNNFQQQEYLDINHSVARILLNIFVMRPGNIPSLPHIGINIRNFLFKTDTDFDAEMLKSLILSQCTELIPGFITGNIDIYFIPDYKGQPMLIITVGTFDRAGGNLINFGFTRSATGDLEYKYEFEKQLGMTTK